MIYQTSVIASYQIQMSGDQFIELKNITSNSRKRKKFTPEEDEILKMLLNQDKSYNWKNVSEFLPGRTPKQCRDRYANYLSNYISNEPWKKEEDELLLMYLSLFGTKWVEISHHIPGRSGNNVKNRWYKHLCKYYTFIPSNGNSLTNTIKISSNNNEKIKKEKNYQIIKEKYSISSLLI